SKVTLTLPSRFGGAALPPPAKLENPFGSFTSAFSQTRTQSGDTIQFNRLLDLKSNLIQPANYASFRDFGEAVDNQDRLRLTGTGGGQ
ncbi:MAG TPA: DUF3858 domain-containing protein, partial [Terriglobales bacterium]|nr:DUF3858 domain-containing protein [Terriglobales bacterium]